MDTHFIGIATEVVDYPPFVKVTFYMFL
jgi:hypothetical protein